MHLILSIAFRQLFARGSQALVIIGGVVLGVTVLLVTLSLFGGLLESFTSRILDVAAHVTMTAESVQGKKNDVLVSGDRGATAAVQLERNSVVEERTRIRNVMTLMRMVERDFGDKITAASPYLTTQVLAVYGVNEITLPVNGVIPSREAKLSGLKDYLESGSVSRLSASRNGVLLGALAAEDLGVSTGDRIRMVSIGGQVISVNVVGVYRFGIGANDRGALVNLRLAQALEEALPSEASGIAFHIADISAAQSVARRIESLTGLETDTWEETNAGFLSIFKFLQILFRVVVGFVIVICGFGVANILITTVLDKQRDIAVMKSFGVSRSGITTIYMVQGLVIGLVGSLLGCAVGAATISLIATLPMGSSGGIVPVSADTYYMSWNPWYFVAAVAGSIFVSLLAAVGPSRSASRVVPVEILRGER